MSKTHKIVFINIDGIVFIGNRNRYSLKKKQQLTTERKKKRFAFGKSFTWPPKKSEANIQSKRVICVNNRVKRIFIWWLMDYVKMSIFHIKQHFKWALKICIPVRWHCHYYCCFAIARVMWVCHNLSPSKIEMRKAQAGASNVSAINFKAWGKPQPKNHFY